MINLDKFKPIKLISFTLSVFLISTMSFAGTIEVSGSLAAKIWHSVQTIETIENIELIRKDASKEFFSLDAVLCVFERYNACSLFSEIKGKRTLVVAMEGTHLLMQSMSDAGITTDLYNSRIDAKNISCSKQDNSINCNLVEY